MRTTLLVSLFTLSSFHSCLGQPPALSTDGFAQCDSFTVRKTVATTAVGGLLAGSLVSSYFDWWKGDPRPFSFIHEGTFNDYSLGIDKIGHAYTAYFYFHAIRNLLLWGGYAPHTAFWWAAGGSAFFALSVEIGDGMSSYGFSVEDLSFNLIGLGYGMLQAEIPSLRNVNFKWSYVPQDGYRWPPHFTDHYDAHIYWLTFNMHRMLPEEMGNWWPEFLQLGVGYGVGDTQSRRELVIGLDINLDAFSLDNQDVRVVQRTLNLFHIPAPGVKFSEHQPPRYRMFLLN